MLMASILRNRDRVGLFGGIVLLIGILMTFAARDGYAQNNALGVVCAGFLLIAPLLWKGAVVVEFTREIQVTDHIADLMLFPELFCELKRWEEKHNQPVKLVVPEDPKKAKRMLIVHLGQYQVGTVTFVKDRYKLSAVKVDAIDGPFAYTNAHKTKVAAHHDDATAALAYLGNLKEPQGIHQH